MQINDLFAAELSTNGIAYEREYRAIPSRQFRYDFFIWTMSKGGWPDRSLLVELQGGTFMKRGGHNTGLGIRRDCEKLNMGILAGYDVMQFTTHMVEDGTAIQQVKEWMEEK